MVNAVSETAELETRYEGQLWRQTFAKGMPTSELEPCGDVSDSGLRLRFRLDDELLPGVHIDVDALADWCAAKTEALPCVVRLIHT